MTSPATSGAHATPPPGAGAPRPAVLVVDDEPMVVELLESILRERYDVHMATSGPEALAFLEGHEVGVLISDQRMPGMTGVQLIAAARQIRPHMISILLTAYTEPRDIIAAINEGHIFRFMTKPWDIADMQLTVKQAMERHLLSAENERMLHDLQRRLRALEVLYRISQQTAFGDTFETVIHTIMDGLDEILPHELAVSLIQVDPSRPATMTLACREALAESSLLEAKERALALLAAHGGPAIDEGQLVVRVSGARVVGEPDPRQPRAFRSAIDVPLRLHDATVGLLFLLDGGEQTYGADDARVLDILANQTTETVRRLREQIGREARRTDQLIAAMQDGVVMTDERGEVLLANRAARALLLPDDPTADLAPELFGRLIGFNPALVLASSGVWERGVQVGPRHLQVTAYPSMIEGVGYGGSVLVLRDVTEQRALEEKKREFISVVSHELRTPLSSITAALDLVLEGITGPISEQQAKYLGMARTSGLRINRLIDDLLEAERYARGRIELTFSSVDLAGLITATVERTRLVAQESDGRSLSTSGVEHRQSVRADERRLEQVLVNLLSNGIKYSPPGSTITVELHQPSALPGLACFSVRSAGEPIPPEQREYIFEKFTRLGQRERRVEGAGLGLAITRAIVDSHGGQIWAEDEGPGGNRFVVVLPAAPASATDEPTDGKPVPLCPFTGPQAAALRGRTLLVAAPRRHDAYGLCAWLRGAEARVHPVFELESLIETAKRLRPAALLLDPRLTAERPNELLALLSNEPDLRRIPIVLLAPSEPLSGWQVAATLSAPYSGPALAAALDRALRLPLVQAHSRTLLVVDDDDAMRMVCEELFTSMGMQVQHARHAQEALARLAASEPDLVLLDINLPDRNGFEVLETLRARPATLHLPVIFCSVRGSLEDKLRSFKLGADDYLVKPFDPLELAARVKAVLGRREHERAVSPTTGLPGSVSIQTEVEGRLAQGRPFALGYLDLDNLKAFNDVYGYAKADAVIHQTSDILREVIARDGHPTDFVGHIAGDDFVFVTAPERVEGICQQVIATFDRFIPLYYTTEDRRRGSIQAVDRFGQSRQFPIMGVSIAVLLVPAGCQRSYPQLAELSASIKAEAKAIPRSVHVVRRLDELPPPPGV